MIAIATPRPASAFVLAAAISVMGAIGWGGIIRSISPVGWAKPAIR
jgi:hypothetical protein